MIILTKRDSAAPHLGLLIRGQLRVDGQNDERRHALADRADAVREHKTRGLNVLLPGHKDQNVARRVAAVVRFRQMQRERERER